jgi:serine/threonine protein kinase
MMLTGLCPFRGGGLELMAAKHRGEYDFDVVIPSPPAQDLVSGLLEVDVSLRLTIDQVLNHRWMIEADDYLERFELDIAKENLGDWDTVPP